MTDANAFNNKIYRKTQTRSLGVNGPLLLMSAACRRHSRSGSVFRWSAITGHGRPVYQLQVCQVHAEGGHGQGGGGNVFKIHKGQYQYQLLLTRRVNLLIKVSARTPRVLLVYQFMQILTNRNKVYMSTLDTLYKIPMTTYDVVLRDSNVTSIRRYSS